MAALKARDPIPAYRAPLLAEGLEAEVLDPPTAEAAFAFAHNFAYPSPEEAFEHVFVQNAG